MDEKAIVDELYEAAGSHGIVDTLIAVFGKGAIIEMGFTQKLCETEVKDMEISVRAYNGLMRAGCKTVGQLIEKINEGTLLNVRNLGIKSAAELRRFIVELGYEQMSEKKRREFLLHTARLNCK